MKDWELSRRELLRGLGVGLGCLPLLQATRSYAASPSFPARFVCVVQPFGYRQAAWLPPVGPLGTLPESVSALEPHKRDLIFLGNLTNPAFKGSRGRGAYGTLFTAGATLPREGEYPVPSGASVDQVVAAGGGAGDSPMRSLALGVQVDVDAGTLPLGGRRCFWQGADQPVAPELDPYTAAARVLGSGNNASAKRLIVERKSILDYVGRELQRFRVRLGTQDRQAIEQHIESVRDVERQLASAQPPGPRCAAVDPAPLGVDLNAGANYPVLLDAQIQLVALALACGLTRVVTLQLADARGSRVPFTFVGFKANDWESIAHAPPGGTDPKVVIDKWCMNKLATLLSAMKAVPEADTTLLVHAAVLWATPVQDGSTEDAQRLPWILAGSCHGFFKTGQSAATAGKPINGVLAQICIAMGVSVGSFGDSSLGPPLAELRP